MKLKLYQVDAFTKATFGGNPAAVVPLEEWLEDDILQSIAEENNLSETAFFVQEGAQYHLRWFTPVFEVDLCGHATLATAHVIFQHLDFPDDTILFKSRSGILKVSWQEEEYRMDFPADQPVRVEDHPEIEKALRQKPIELYKGRDDYLAIFDSEETINNLAPDFQGLGQIKGCRGLITSAPGKNSTVDFVSRCFYPVAGINEDPVTGSAHTLMTPYWSAKLNKFELSAIQISKRRGQIQCKMEGDRVSLSGNAVTYLDGNITI